MSLCKEELAAFAAKNIEIGSEADALHNDCNITEFLLDNCEITVPEGNRFFVSVNCAGIHASVFWNRAQKFSKAISEYGFHDGNAALAYTGDFDFGHTSTEWESVISLGIFGLRERILQYRRRCPDDAKKQRFYREALRVYDAALRFVKRAAQTARSCGKSEMADGLERLSQSRPSSLYEAMQTSIVYYTLQHIVEGTNLRTMGRLDSLFYPFFVKESPENAEQLLRDYICEIDNFKVLANIPFALGGTNPNGESLINELSYLILKTYVKLKPSDTKMHLLCSDNTPAGIIREALESVRAGCNSIVFMSDGKIIEALEKLGEKHSDAVNYHVVGCYESGGNNELTCSCNARVNLAKALELTLTDGVDILTGKRIGCKSGSDVKDYGDFFESVKAQLTHLCRCAMEETNLWEKKYAEIHASPILSGTYTSALEKGGDLYCDRSAAYNNSSLNAIGLATLTDSLYTIKELVFEKKLLTLDRLVQILRADWENEEPLRLKIKRTLPKYGMGNKAVDSIAAEVVGHLSSVVNNAPNVKGGVYRLGLFSIDWRWEFGKRTAASADGRHKGETLSQNMSATFGADKNGVTGHILSACAIDASNVANGAILDIDLHPSAVSGEDGLDCMVSTLKIYFKLGGACVHYNVLDTEALKDARLHPEKYPNLQVRLCGWNVLFANLSDREKDEFIARSIK